MWSYGSRKTWELGHLLDAPNSMSGVAAGREQPGSGAPAAVKPPQWHAIEMLITTKAKNEVSINRQIVKGANLREKCAETYKSEARLVAGPQGDHPWPTINK